MSELDPQEESINYSPRKGKGFRLEEIHARIRRSC